LLNSRYAPPPPSPDTLSLHDALPICPSCRCPRACRWPRSPSARRGRPMRPCTSSPPWPPPTTPCTPGWWRSAPARPKRPATWPCLPSPEPAAHPSRARHRRMTSSSASFTIAPGDWLGLLGGGQLGRMFCHAAQSLGYRVAVLDPAADGPAAMVADRHIQAAYDDPAGLAELARSCRAVTTEFENVPAESLRALAARQCRVSPAADAVAIVQDRIAEKTFIAA